MSDSVVSKNLFDLLGNDIEDGESNQGPVKTVDKNTTRTTKRNVEPVAPAKPATANTGRRGPGGNEGAFRDRNAGHSANQRRTTEEAPRGGPRGGRGARQRGGRGGGYPRDRDDRHPRGLASGSEKQAAQSWGAQEGDAEQKDEQAGEEIAQSELKDAVAEDAQGAESAEPENKNISYEDYLVQQAEKKLALGSLEIRKANEGSKVDKKWSNVKELAKDDAEDFIAGSGGKAKRERERKQKQTVDIDHSFVEQDRPRGGARGGRGGPRGGRGGDRGGRGEGRGEHRGARGGPRGGARGDSAPLNPSDKSAFPSLGA